MTSGAHSHNVPAMSEPPPTPLSDFDWGVEEFSLDPVTGELRYDGGAVDSAVRGDTVVSASTGGQDSGAGIYGVSGGRGNAGGNPRSKRANTAEDKRGRDKKKKVTVDEIKCAVHGCADQVPDKRSHKAFPLCKQHRRCASVVVFDVESGQNIDVRWCGLCKRTQPLSDFIDSRGGEKAEKNGRAQPVQFSCLEVFKSFREFVLSHRPNFFKFLETPFLATASL